MAQPLRTPSPLPAAEPPEGRQPAGIHVIRGAGNAAAMLSPLRRRIVEALMEPDSASGVARRLGLPRQRINYHVRMLEQEGLLRTVRTRPRGSCTERLVQAVARHYLIAPQALGELAADPAALRDRFSSSYLMAVAAAAIRDIATLQERDGAAADLPTLTLQTEVRFASAGARKAFAEELASAVTTLIEKYHSPDEEGAHAFRVLLGAYPAPPPKPDSETLDPETP
ncbi:MAG TPA: helix-turn-helix domain-containing protein [Longimicrobiales bacterium]|nr:helix-turn-helix domain-containing protein [Longimicrobiales bacterium]